MGLLSITRAMAIAGTIIGLLGIVWRLDDIMRRPFKEDLSRARGARWRGVLYAFTLGMAPWEKESGRLHWVTYIRGVLFHVGIFAAFAALFASPWWSAIPLPLIWLVALVTGAGALAGFAGLAMRWIDTNERALSVPDDYAAVFVTSVFTACACLALLWPAALPAFYLVAAATFIYVPFSKIRHCVFFFYSRFFFGAGFGHRGVVGQPRRGDLA